MDVSDAKSIEAAANEIDAGFGSLDVVINNAAIIGDRKPILDSDPYSWWQVCMSILRSRCLANSLTLKSVNVNVRGPYLISKACIPPRLTHC